MQAFLYRTAIHIPQPAMRPNATHVAWSVCVSACVPVSVTAVSPAKTDEPIEMPLGTWTRGMKKPSIS